MLIGRCIDKTLRRLEPVMAGDSFESHPVTRLPGFSIDAGLDSALGPPGW